MSDEEQPEHEPEAASLPGRGPRSPDLLAEAGAPAPPGAVPADRSRRPLVLLAAALFGLSVGLAALSAVLAARLDDERTTRRDVRELSGRFALALLTYDYDDLDRARDRVVSMSTGKFKREYEEAFRGELSTLIQNTKARSEATVTDIFVGEVEDDTAGAIVVADAKASGTSGEERTVASYIRLELVRVAGRWRVDGVTNLNFGQNRSSAARSTTTTTAPK